MRREGGRTPVFSEGVVLVLVAIAAIAASAVSPWLGLAIFLAVPIGWILRYSEIRALLPRSGPSWLGSAVLVVLPIAPALGDGGTYLRLLLTVFLAPAALHYRKNARSDDLFMYLLVSFLAVLLVAAFAAPSLTYGIVRLINWIMFIPLILLPFHRRDLLALCGALLASCYVQMAGVLLQGAGVLGGTRGGIFVIGTTYDPSAAIWLRRYTGFIGDPNSLGLLLAMGVVAALILAISPDCGLRSRILLLLSIGAFAYGIVLSGSRGALVAVGLGLALSLWRSGGWARLGLAVIFAAVLFARGLIQWTPLTRVVNSLGDITGGTDSSSIQRAGVWKERLHEAVHWIGGDGFGTYDGSSFANQSGLRVAKEAARSATVDNSWLKLLLECGVIGIALMLVMFARAVWVTRRHDPEDTSLRLTAAALSALIVMIFWRSLSVDILDINPWNGIIWLVFGLSFAIFSRRPPHIRTRTAKDSRAPRVAAASAGRRSASVTQSAGATTVDHESGWGGA